MTSHHRGRSKMSPSKEESLQQELRLCCTACPPSPTCASGAVDDSALTPVTLVELRENLYAKCVLTCFGFLLDPRVFLSMFSHLSTTVKSPFLCAKALGSLFYRIKALDNGDRPCATLKQLCKRHLRYGYSSDKCKCNATLTQNADALAEAACILIGCVLTAAASRSGWRRGVPPWRAEAGSGGQSLRSPLR